VRSIITIVAVLIILGLVAFGVVSAQKMSTARRFACCAGIAARVYCGAASSRQSPEPSGSKQFGSRPSGQRSGYRRSRCR
jgi:hypothetical protein